MKQLDSVIARRGAYLQNKEGRLSALHREYLSAKMTWRDSTCYCTFMTNTIHLILIRHIT